MTLKELVYERIRKVLRIYGFVDRNDKFIDCWVCAEVLSDLQRDIYDEILAVGAALTTMVRVTIADETLWIKVGKEDYRFN